jgi:hypothetical protein
MSSTADMAESTPLPPDMAPAPPDFALGKRSPTDHPAEPELTNFGGSVLSAIELYTIVWQGDSDLGAQVERFHSWMVKSDYWTQSLAEYGVGAGKSMGLIVLPGNAPSTLDDSWFHSNIAQLIKAGTLPAPTANTSYAFIVPSSSQSTMCYGGGCIYGCQSYGGYHSATDSGTGQNVSYEVNLQCPGFGSGSAFDQLTDTLSHEAAEAATDPQPQAPTWINPNLPYGSEVGDLCVGLESTQHATFTDVDGGTVDSADYIVTRLYSTKRAHDGTSDPCVPEPKHPFFGVGIDPTDWQVQTDSTGHATAMAKIEPWAFGDVGPIKCLIPNPGRGIHLSPSSGTSLPGDTIWVTATISNAQSSQYSINVYSQAASGGESLWFSSLTINP